MVENATIGTKPRTETVDYWLSQFERRDRSDANLLLSAIQSAARKWRRLDGSHRLAEIVEGVKFKDGEKLIERAA